MADWDDLDKASAVRWAQGGPKLLDTIAADGSAMARGGQLDLAGTPGELFAAGARVGVLTYYMRTPPLDLDEAGLRAMLHAAGLKADLARCPVARSAGRERLWFRVSKPTGGEAAVFYAGPEVNGPGDAYALYLKTELPLLKPQDVGRYTEQCGSSSKTAFTGPSASALPSQGYQAAAALLIDWMSLGDSGAVPFAVLQKQTAVKWYPKVFTRTPPGFSSEEVWDERGTRFLNGPMKTATTEMNAAAFGDAAGAKRFYLKDGANLPRGAVFAELQRRGFTLTVLRCGKPYTQESIEWRRITGPTGQSAVLARTVSIDGALRTEAYALRLDNVLPPIRPGETPAAGGCRSL